MLLGLAGLLFFDNLRDNASCRVFHWKAQQGRDRWGYINIRMFPRRTPLRMFAPEATKIARICGSLLI